MIKCDKMWWDVIRFDMMWWDVISTTTSKSAHLPLQKSWMFFFALQFSFSLSIGLTLYSPTHHVSEAKRTFKTRGLHPILDYGFSWIAKQKKRTAAKQKQSRRNLRKAEAKDGRIFKDASQVLRENSGGTSFFGFLLRLSHAEIASSL